MNKSQLVKILVPIYRSDLNKFERISLERNDKILQAYPRVFIKPASLDISKLQKEFPDFTVENFDNECFTCLQHYNQLMMSPEFYQRFCDTEYILICQLDAYIFKDELTKWCEKGYDYIGAPWIIPLKYHLPFIRQYRNWIRKPGIQKRDNKVGNGGLSLRKTSSHLKATTELQDIIRHYTTQTIGHLYNEDVFFAVEVNKHGMNFSYPTCKEALKFSFDKYPKLCYDRNKHQLPFGCHAWFKEKALKFWSQFIEFPTGSSL